MPFPVSYGSNKFVAATGGESILDDGDLNFSVAVVSLTDADSSTTLPSIKSSFYAVSRTSTSTTPAASTIIFPSQWAFIDTGQFDTRNSGWRVRVHYVGETTNLTIQLDASNSFQLSRDTMVEIIWSPSSTTGIVMGSTINAIPLYILNFGV